jgi:hypothetical protein
LTLAKSPLITAPGQTLEFSPISTFPTTYAASLTQADLATFGFFPLTLLINFASFGLAQK